MRLASRLDAFSVYPVQTWLPCDGVGLQQVHQWSVRPGPLVLGVAPLKYPTPAPDRDRTVSRRSEPSSRTALMGEQPNPWDCHRSTDKSYPGDNRLISPKSSHRRGGLAPRCRLIASWGWRRSQGLGCSPIKAVRELGSERRETVRSLSVVGVGYLRGAVLSTRGPEWTYQLCTGCHANGTAG